MFKYNIQHGHLATSLSFNKALNLKKISICYALDLVFLIPKVSLEVLLRILYYRNFLLGLSLSLLRVGLPVSCTLIVRGNSWKKVGTSMGVWAKD
jgi:hypothetical protein